MTTPNPTAEQIIAEAISAYWADEERSGPNRGPNGHDRECGIDAAKALRAHGLLSEGASHEPMQNKAKSSQDFVMSPERDKTGGDSLHALNTVKVAAVVAQVWADTDTPDDVARAVCAAFERGELT